MGLEGSVYIVSEERGKVGREEGGREGGRNEKELKGDWQGGSTCSYLVFLQLVFSNGGVTQVTCGEGVVFFVMCVQFFYRHWLATLGAELDLAHTEGPVQVKGRVRDLMFAAKRVK